LETQFKIIGGDGREYGPATLNELKSWVHDGRVAGATPIWRSDTGLWSPASHFTELRGDLAQVIAAAGLAAATAARPAGFWARLGAYIIDRIFLSFVGTFVWSFVAAIMHWKNVPPPDNMQTLQDVLDYLHSLGPVLAYQMLVISACGFVYEVIFNGTFGATLGKMAIGARIVRLDGSRLTYGIAAARWLCERLSDMLLFTGYLFIAFREDKRALHDLLAGTRVILHR
jgi:uncharacterized RDD family membrane protein YckC